MAKAKRYTAEQLSDAEKMAATLANVPEEKENPRHNDDKLIHGRNGSTESH